MIGMVARPFDMVMSAQTGDSASSGTYPKANLANNDYGRVWRNTSGAIATYQEMIDLGSAKSVDCLAVLWHNLRAGDQIRIRAGDTVANASAGTLYSGSANAAITGATQRDPDPGLYKHLLTLGTPIVARYWAFQFLVNGTVHPAGYIQASRLFVGKRHDFVIGPQRAELGAVDYNQKIQLETGEDRASEDSLLIRPMVSLDIRYAKESEMATFFGQYSLSLGVSKPMLISTDLTAATNFQDQLAFGRPEKVMNMQSEIWDVWQFQAQVRSIGP